ncbi:MAG: SRPBCC family protein [Actinomycetota bacterium]|nr:SRPBCC family protein [Actinomycetota bacterium]
MRTSDVALTVMLPTDIQSAYNAIVDWQGQSDWMIGTKVWLAGGDGASVGSQIAAFTGIWKLGFLDTMTITKIEPPRLVEVLHTGKVLRGEGSFELIAVTERETQFNWFERVEIPAGLAGLAAWWLIRPGFKFGVWFSLRKLAKSL